MTSEAKRLCLDPVETAISKFDSAQEDGFSIYRPEAYRLPPLVETFRSEIRPGRGLVGNCVEEATFNRTFQEETDSESLSPQSDDFAADETRTENTEEIEYDTIQNTPEDGDNDEDEVEGVEEDITDIVILPDGELMHVSQYFGIEYEKRIKGLHEVEPMECPANMPTIPHKYQLKGAAQLTYLCESPSRGGLLGDPMGLGKTLTAILHLWTIKDQPGVSLVLCPASLRDQWQRAIEGAFEEGYGLTAFQYTDPCMSAHQLQAQGVDVVIASYEAYERNCTSKYMTGEEVGQIAAHIHDGDVITAKRPTCGLASDLGYFTYMPWKRVIIDEIQNLKNWDASRHTAIASISTRAFIGLSGTLPHNRWTDVGGYLDFIKGHPYTNQNKFLAQFTRGAYSASRSRPSPAAMTLLQRFFMAFTIIRPKDSLKLPPCRRVAFELKLPVHQAERVEELTERYRVAAQMSQDGAVDSVIGENGDASALGCAIQAQLHQLHPGLTPEAEELYDPKQDIANVTAEELNDKFSNEESLPEENARARWMRELESWPKSKIMDSAHLTAIVNLVHHISDVLSQKVVIFSQYLRYLDLLDIALRDRGIVAFRYDGTVHTSMRSRVQEQFQTTENCRPILMTVGAGGIGLNLTAANIMILCEELWNENAIAQAIARLHRQGQSEEVLVIKNLVTNSAIDLEIVRVRETKVQVNADLLKPLIVPHDAQPTIPKLLY